jgi:hypothetical protein
MHGSWNHRVMPAFGDVEAPKVFICAIFERRETTTLFDLKVISGLFCQVLSGESIRYYCATFIFDYEKFHDDCLVLKK